MAAKKKLDPRTGGVIVLVLILLLALLVWIFPVWDLPQAGVVVKLDPDNVEILGIKKFRYGGQLLCSFCVGYDAEIEVFANGARICSNKHFVGGLGKESFHIGVKCPQL